MRKLFEKACCFAGPESIPEEQERRIIARINHVMDRLISKEIFQFYTGAATGFDLLAARAVLERKQSDSRVRPFPSACLPDAIPVVSSTGAIFSRNDRGGGRRR